MLALARIGLQLTTNLVQLSHIQIFYKLPTSLCLPISLSHSLCLTCSLSLSLSLSLSRLLFLSLSLYLSLSLSLSRLLFLSLSLSLSLSLLHQMKTINTSVCTRPYAKCYWTGKVNTSCFLVRYFFSVLCYVALHFLAKRVKLYVLRFADYEVYFESTSTPTSNYRFVLLSA